MPNPSFDEWVSHWGESRLNEMIAVSQECYRGMWEERDGSGGARQFPAWELYLGVYWEESLTDWHSRWQRCGGRLCDGRMIAAKWDGIWVRLSSTFYDGLGHPYPPYARSSCARWVAIGQDEAIVTGAISESELSDYMARFPRKPLTDEDGNPISKEFLRALRNDIEEQLYRNGGPRPGASREERVAHERKQHDEMFTRSQAEYAERNRERDRERNDQDVVFRLLEQVEATVRESASVTDPRRWEWLCNSVNALTTTNYFERYPNWKARAWVACAEVHHLASDSKSELSCLEHALSINGKLGIKRRIKKLQGQQKCA